VPELFSQAWFESLAAALKELPVSADASEASIGLSVGQIVTGVPDYTDAVGVADGEVRYTIVLRADGSASLIVGSTEAANVVLVEDWTTARAISSGQTSVGDLLTAGRIRVRGDSRELVSAGDLLARVAPLISEALSTSRE
jgi:hypothetical protein